MTNSSEILETGNDVGEMQKGIGAWIWVHVCYIGVGQQG